MNGIKLYFRYISVSLQSQMQYRMSFVMMTLASFVVNFTDFLGIWILFDRFGTLQEWSLGEVALFYGMIHMAFAMAEAIARGFDVFHRQVRSGDFDRVLLRPRSTTLQILGQELQLMRLGRFIQGLLVLLWAIQKLQIAWSLEKFSLLLGGILGGACLFSGLFVLQATLSFWSVEGLEVANTVTYGGVQTAQYPLSIYTGWFRKFFIFIIPLGCINYFPAIGILGKIDPLGSTSFIQWISPCIGVMFLLLSLQIWKFGVSHYCSTGS